MARFKSTLDGLVSFTAAEEAEWDLMEAEYEAGAGARLALEVREERDTKLRDSDWAVLADAPTDKTAWQAYRQELRDVPQQEGFPNSINWPTEPE